MSSLVAEMKALLGRLRWPGVSAALSEREELVLRAAMGVHDSLELRSMLPSNQPPMAIPAGFTALQCVAEPTQVHVIDFHHLLGNILIARERLLISESAVHNK